MEVYKEKQTRIRQKLSHAKSQVNISFDLWSSSNGLPLCGVVGHFIDHEGFLRTLLLGLRELIGEHSGENIAGVVADVIRDYRIASRIGYFVLDNAKNNDTALQMLSTTLTIDPTKQRLRCAGHIINLVVKAILFGEGVSKFERALAGAGDDEQFDLWRKRGPIGKLHNIVVYINRSPQRQQQFRSKQDAVASDDNIPKFYYQLIQDGGVRWNSSYNMIERALQVRNAVDLFTLHDQQANGPAGLVDDRLTADDWQQLEEFRAFLQPFKDMTERLEGNAHNGSHGALWEVLPSMDFMLGLLESHAIRLAQVPESYFKTGVDLGWAKLRKYYTLTDLSPVYRAAILLHPIHKWEYFEEKWAKHPRWIKDAKSVIRELWQVYKQKHAPDVAVADLDSSSELSEFDSFLKLSGRRRLADEYDRYCALPPDDTVKNPLQWWRDHEKAYPILSQLAFDLLSIPGMSSECERVFSQAKKMITVERNRFKSDMVEAEECTKNWLTHGLVRISPGPEIP